MGILDDIKTHIEMLSTERMRAHAFIDPERDHDVAFQIYRYLSGYDEALQQIAELELKIHRAYSFLKCVGVSKERAGSVANGIDVYASRMWKEEMILRARIEMLEEKLNGKEKMGSFEGKQKGSEDLDSEKAGKEGAGS